MPERPIFITLPVPPYPIATVAITAKSPLRRRKKPCSRWPDLQATCLARARRLLFFEADNLPQPSCIEITEEPQNPGTPTPFGFRVHEPCNWPSARGGGEGGRQKGAAQDGEARSVGQLGEQAKQLLSVQQQPRGAGGVGRP